MTRVRVAAVSYLNTIPMLYGITQGGRTLSDSLLLAPPAECADLYKSGQVDISLMPVYEIANLENTEIITNFCIGTKGDVRTVVLLSNNNLCDIKKIYLDYHSRTSAALIKILCNDLWGIFPQWELLNDYSKVLNPSEGEGFMLIGDKVFDYEKLFEYNFDLAHHWREFTSLPFVFAAWVARKGVDPEFISELNCAIGYGVSHIEDAVNKYRPDIKTLANDYLTNNIDFVFDEQKHRALALFWQKGMKSIPLVNPG